MLDLPKQSSAPQSQAAPAPGPQSLRPQMPFAQGPAPQTQPPQPPPAPGTISLEPGETLALDKAGMGYRVYSGRCEIYASLLEDGKTSGRHFLFEIAKGDLLGPLATQTGHLHLIALAVEESRLEPRALEEIAQRSKVDEQRAATVAELDQSIARLSGAVGTLVGPAPTDTAVLNAGETADAATGAVFTARTGVAWLTSPSATLSYCGQKPAASFDATCVAAIAAGTWVTVTAPGRVAVETTAAVLAQPEWTPFLGSVQSSLLALIEDSLRARQAAARKAVESRVTRSGRVLQRVFGRFDAVLGTIGPQTSMAHAPDEPLVAPFVTIAAKLAVDLNSAQRDRLARCRTVDEAARAVRLRNRQITLRGNWRGEDLGPLIGFVDEERRPVALIPAVTGWQMIEGEGTKPIAIDSKVAARIAPNAHMLYPPFADKPLNFHDFLGFGWRRIREDVYTAAVMSLAGALLGLATPFAMQLAFDRFIPGHQTLSLIELAIGLILAAAIAAGFRVVYDFAFLRVEGRTAGAMQAAIMDRVLRIPDHTLRMSPGDLASRIGSGEQLRRSVYAVALGSLSAFFFLITNIGMMFYYSPMAAGAAVGLFLLLSLIAAFCAHHQLDAVRRGEQLMADIYSIVFQLVQGITALRAAGAEDRAFARWGMDFAELRTRSFRARSFSTLFETSLAAFELAALAVILLLLSYMPREELSTGAFIAFITAYGAYMGASLQIVRGVVGVWNAKPSWERTAPLLRAVPEGVGTKRDPGQLSGAIDITGAYFRYGPEAPFALQGVSVSVAPGEFVALVGPSGSGKSTLMRLLLGFEQPLSGAIQYDQQDLRFLDLELVRRQIGVVLQNSALFPGTLYENIMGVIDGTMDDAWAAARQAGIEADIKAMPMGMHTVVTEATAAFSGGQIQRFAIARALVGKPRILLLDEATSALDNLTQMIVTESLDRLAVTRLVIAHRLTTVKKANRIIVLDRGKVAQTGKFEELAAAPGPFAELARRQLL